MLLLLQGMCTTSFVMEFACAPHLVPLKVILLFSYFTYSSLILSSLERENDCSLTKLHKHPCPLSWLGCDVTSLQSLLWLPKAAWMPPWGAVAASWILSWPTRSHAEVYLLVSSYARPQPMTTWTFWGQALSVVHPAERRCSFMTWWAADRWNTSWKQPYKG